MSHNVVQSDSISNWTSCFYFRKIPRLCSNWYCLYNLKKKNIFFFFSTFFFEKLTRHGSIWLPFQVLWRSIQWLFMCHLSSIIYFLFNLSIWSYMKNFVLQWSMAILDSINQKKTIKKIKGPFLTRNYSITHEVLEKIYWIFSQ